MKSHLPWETKGKLLSGPHLWICPKCGKVNTWNEDDAVRASAKLKVDVYVCRGSCFDNVCGHCHSNIIEPNSPILASCYTHSED